MKPNSNVRGRSRSTHEEADRVKIVSSSVPNEGVEVKAPGRGGPLVVMRMEECD